MPMSRAPQPTVQRRADLLRFDGVVERDPAIDLWFSKHSGELGAIARRWFTMMRECGDEVRERLHDGCPVACLGDAPFGYVNVFTLHVNVGFFHGASLPDPAHLLQGQGKSMRHVKLKSGGTIVGHAKPQPAMPANDSPTNATNAAANDTPNDAALAQLIAAAYSDIKSRIENG